MRNGRADLLGLRAHFLEFKEKQTMKKMLSLLLTLALCLGLAAPAFAADEEFVIENGVLVSYSGSGGKVAVPDGVTVIGENAFQGKRVTEVTLPDSVTRIGARAFYACGELTSVNLPAGITSIGESAFEGCYALRGSLVIPERVTKIEKSAFWGCEGLTGVTLPRGLAGIGDYAFCGCSGLTSMTVPERVTSIGTKAFEGCTGLTSLTLPEGLESVGSYAFAGCTRLTGVTVPGSITDNGGSLFWNCTGLASAVIGAGTSEIGVDQFSGCTGLTSVVIPEGVETICAGAFGFCTGLTGVTLPSSISSIGYYAFLGCESLTSIVLPNGATDIDDHAFDRCPNLTITRPGGQTVSTQVELPPLRNTYSTAISDGAAYYLEVGDMLSLTNTRSSGSMSFPAYYFDLKGNESGVIYAPNTNGSSVQFMAVKPGVVTVAGTLSGSIPKTNYGSKYNDATKQWERYTYTTYEQQLLTTTVTIVVRGAGEPTEPVQPQEPGFTDVAADSFFAEATSWAAGREIVVGNPDGSFGIGAQCKKEHILTFLWRAEGKPEPTIANPYSNLDETLYYAKAAIWAYEKGLITAKNLDFGSVCTRFQAVNYLWKLAGSPNPAQSSSFSDVPDGFTDAVSWAVEQGITQGIGDGKFGASDPCTREQIVTFLWRAYAK